MLLHRAAPKAATFPLRLSIAVSLERARAAVRDMMALATPRLPEHYGRLLGALARVVVPLRPGRSPPPEVEIKMSPYPYKKPASAA